MEGATITRQRPPSRDGDEMATVSEPKSNQVVVLHVHEPNRTFRGLIQKRSFRDQEADHNGKDSLIEQIVKVLRGEGYDFVKQDTDYAQWVPVPPLEIQAFVETSFREHHSKRVSALPEPTESQIVFGRGSLPYRHNPNITFRATIAKQSKRYLTANRVDKRPRMLGTLL